MCESKKNRGSRRRDENEESVRNRLRHREGGCVYFGCVTCKMIGIISEIIINMSEHKYVWTEFETFLLLKLIDMTLIRFAHAQLCMHTNFPLTVSSHRSPPPPHLSLFFDSQCSSVSYSLCVPLLLFESGSASASLRMLDMQMPGRLLCCVYCSCHSLLQDWRFPFRNRSIRLLHSSV